MNELIVIVEDEFAIAEAIVMNLEMESYQVKHFANGRDALNQLEQLAKANLVILDVMLPEVNGINICKALKEISTTPVLFLSAKGTSSDKVEGLKNGGDDYLSKPFDLEELLLRVKILLQRNTKSNIKNEIQIGDKLVDFKTYIVSDTDGHEIGELSKREIGLLRLFIEKNGEVISRNELLDKVWGENQFPTSRTIDNFILNFRKLFEKDPKNPRYFHSIRGVGYKFTL